MSKTGFTSLGSTYSISFYLIYTAHLIKWKYIGALVYYPGVTNPLYNTIPTWKCSIIATHVPKAGDGSMTAHTFAMTADVHWLCMFVRETNSVLHTKALYISGFVVWRILECTQFYANKKLRKYANRIYSTPTYVFTSHSFRNRHSQNSKSYLYLPNIEYFATWL
jgi:hypothetical protein